jgi:hypothetical protein
VEEVARLVQAMAKQLTPSSKGLMWMLLFLGFQQ